MTTTIASRGQVAVVPVTSENLIDAIDAGELLDTQRRASRHRSSQHSSRLGFTALSHRPPDEARLPHRKDDFE